MFFFIFVEVKRFDYSDYIAGGGTNGPLATKWNVHQWPTLYILASNGIIRYRDVRNKKIEGNTTFGFRHCILKRFFINFFLKIIP